MQVDAGIDALLSQEVLHRTDLGLGGGIRAGNVPGDGTHLGLGSAFGVGLRIEAVPLIVEGAVHVDAAAAGIVAENVVAVPVGALHTEAVELGLGPVGAELLSGDLVRSPRNRCRR